MVRVSDVTYQCLAGPVELAVVAVALAIEEVLEQAPQVIVVGRLEEVQTAHVPQIGGELLRMVLAQTLQICETVNMLPLLSHTLLATHLDRGGALRVADLLVALLERVSLEALPRQRAAQEIHEHVTERLQIVAPRLLPAHVSIDGHVPSGAGQRFVFPIWYVLVGV